MGTSRPHKPQDCANRTGRVAATVMRCRRPSFGGGAGAQKRVILCFARSERACSNKLLNLFEREPLVRRKRVGQCRRRWGGKGGSVTLSYRVQQLAHLSVTYTA